MQLLCLPILNRKQKKNSFFASERELQGSQSGKRSREVNLQGQFKLANFDAKSFELADEIKSGLGKISKLKIFFL